MTRCATASSIRILRATLAAALPLALGACAGGIDTKPDKPFKTADVCADSAVPAGWIRTNDWRGKGCGIDDSATARGKSASIQLASTATAPKAKAKPKLDISRGAN